MAPTGTSPVEADHDRMVDRGEVIFLDVVARAGVGDVSLQVDAEAVDHVARPAAAVALHLQRVFGCKDAAPAQAFGVELEVALLAKQAEAVLHLPGNLQGLVGGGLRRRMWHGQRPKRAAEQRTQNDRTKRKAAHGARLTLQLGRK